MPDLTVHDKNVLAMMLNNYFGRAGIHTFPGRHHLFNLARLIDHTVREYENARAACREYTERTEGQPTPMSALFRMLSHLETCVVSLWRAVKHAEVLQSLHRREDPWLPKIESADLPRKPERDVLESVRDAIIHTKDEIAAGEPAMLLKADRVEFSGQVITYRELARWIDQLGTLAQRLYTFENPRAEGEDLELPSQ